MNARLASELSPFDFFRRTSLELCQAITQEFAPGRSVIIKRHLDRIEDIRLRNVFAAAVDIGLPQRPAESAKAHHSELWRGLV